MKRTNGLVVTGLVLAGLAGCIPEKRVVWSPDGRQAAVVGADGLYLCDGDGRLSERIVENVAYAAWFPDSRRLLAVRTVKAPKWDDVAPVLAPERQTAVIDAARALREEVLAYDGDWDKFEPKAIAALTGDETAAGFLYLRDHLSAGLPEKVGEKWKSIHDLQIEVHVVQVYHVDDGRARPGDVILRSVNDVFRPVISPTGDAMAFVGPMANEDDGTGNLYVMPLVPGAQAVEVAERVAMFPAWSADGRRMNYAWANVPVTSNGDELRLGAVSRRVVRGEDGMLLTELPEPQHLAGILFHPHLKVHGMSDGRILFAASEMHLPCTAKDMPQRLSLFAVDPDRQATVTRVIPRAAEQELGAEVGLFEVSPDETRVAIPIAKGRVAVFTIATGDVAQVHDADDVDDKIRTVPVWRSNSELCVAVPTGSSAGSPDRAEIVLWSGDQSRCISKDWPAETVREFLTDEEKKSPSGDSGA